jgi:hypothetical protein
MISAERHRALEASRPGEAVHETRVGFVTSKQRKRLQDNHPKTCSLFKRVGREAVMDWQLEVRLVSKPRPFWDCGVRLGVRQSWPLTGPCHAPCRGPSQTTVPD